MRYFRIRLASFVGWRWRRCWLRAGGDEVVVVYNSRVPESKAVAEYYAQVRQVPEKQILRFRADRPTRRCRAPNFAMRCKCRWRAGWRRTAFGGLAGDQCRDQRRAAKHVKPGRRLQNPLRRSCATACR